MFRLEKGGLQGIGLSLKSQMAVDEGDLFSLAQRAKLRSAQITGHRSRLTKINYFLIEMFYCVGQKVHLGFSDACIKRPNQIELMVFLKAFP